MVMTMRNVALARVIGVLVSAGSVAACGEHHSHQNRKPTRSFRKIVPRTQPTLNYTSVNCGARGITDQYRRASDNTVGEGAAA
jgi:hypothetical protein